MPKGSLHTLMFHGVVDSLSEHCLFNGTRNCFVRTHDFEKIIRYCSNHYKIIRQEELESYINGTASEDGIFISVDDGLQNFADNAIPVLEQYKTPATIFITSDWTNNKIEPAIFALEYYLYHRLPATVSIRTGSFSFQQNIKHKKELPVFFTALWNKLFAEKIPPNSITAEEIIINAEKMSGFSVEKNPEYWKPASWEQLNTAVQKNIIQIGAHGKTYTPFNWLNADELKNEFSENTEQIKKHLNITVNTCTFPYGMYNNETLAVVGTHYQYGFTNRVITDNNQNGLHLSRYNVPYQRPNNISSLISYPFAGRVLRKVGAMSNLF